MNWENDGEELRNYERSGVTKTNLFFRESVSWTDISSSYFGVRYYAPGIIGGNTGPCIYPEHKDAMYLCGLMTSKASTYFMRFLSPTIHNNVGDVIKLPVVFDENRRKQLEELTVSCIEKSRDDWDSFETSWGFQHHPLVPSILKLQKKNFGRISRYYDSWREDCNSRFSQLIENEEELNRMVIDIYGLQNELTPKIDEEDITVRKGDLQRDIKSLLSYAVGCMFGRYSLDVDGLVYAGGAWDGSKYTTFIPDADNVIPITDEEYLEDDIVSRLCTWLKVVYGESTLEENLDFIARAIGNRGSSSREIIRNYFLNDFFKEHCQTYSVTGSGKRPIYWLFDSGKQNGFKALIYLHRYDANTVGNLRIDYLHRIQRVYENEISRMQDMINHSTNAREVGQATKRRDKLTKQLKECREYDEKLAHLALSRIELDLDDGVKVNYRKVQTANDGKFYEVLADSNG